MESPKFPILSVVVPVYNEEGNLPLLIPKLEEVLKGLGQLYEILFVDDGSSDGSRRILKEMTRQYPFLRVLCFKENRGLSAALAAGMREARGEKSMHSVKQGYLFDAVLAKCSKGAGAILNRFTAYPVSNSVTDFGRDSF